MNARPRSSVSVTDKHPLYSYFNLGQHHIPDTSDLPNTVFTTAHSGVILTPSNYNDNGDASRATIHQTRINVINGTVIDALTFGTRQPTCSLDLSVTSPNLQSFVGEVYVPKYPYHPDEVMVGDLGAGIGLGAGGGSGA